VITLYAITDHPTPPIPADIDLHVVAGGELAALCGPAVTREVTAEALWEHERRVEALMRDRDLLPVRYGTCVDDEAAAARALADNHCAYAASLETVRGAVELAVRVFAGDEASAPAETAPAAAAGTAYLRARARSAAAESEASSLVHEPLTGLARDARAARVPRPGELLRAAYLVDRDGTAAFSACVHEIQERCPQLRITCTGPWPPYSFTGS
jgi:hypothetical protein